MIGHRLVWFMMAASASFVGCARQPDPEIRVVLAALDSLVSQVPETWSKCVSTRYLTNGELPEDLQKTLLERGWSLYDPMWGADSLHRPALPPDTGSSLIIIDWPSREGEEWVLNAGLTETQLTRDWVTWAVYDWKLWVTCDAEGCDVTALEAGGHGDGIVGAAEFFQRHRQACGLRGKTPGPRSR